MKAARTLTAFALASLAWGCTSEQGYYAGQGWQRNECNRTPDNADRERCLARTGSSYEAYRREAGAIK